MPVAQQDRAQTSEVWGHGFEFHRAHHYILNMITRMLIKFMFAVARMSKKASLIYIIIVSLIFVISTCGFIAGLIYIDPEGETPVFGIPILISSAICLFLCVAAVALTAIASNYVRKNPHKDPKKEKPSSNQD